MNRGRLPVLSAVLLGLYLLFAGLTTLCLTGVDGSLPSHKGHHHHGMAHHSGLCAWACQANPAAAILSHPLTLPALSVAERTVPALGHLPADLSVVFLPSRAPPL